VRSLKKLVISPFALLAMILVGQEPTGIKGLVADTLAASIGGVEVRVLEPDSRQIVARAQTNKLGAFQVEVPRPGAYLVTVRVRAFRLGIWPNVVVHDHEMTNLGPIKLEIPGCDAPGVICDTFSAQPVFPGLVNQAAIEVGLNCGADLRRAAVSCTQSVASDFALDAGPNGVFVKPLNGHGDLRAGDAF